MADLPADATHPYAALPPRAFWRSAVAGRPADALEGIWTPRLRLAPTDRVVTFGSCFAQHIGRALEARGYAWHDAEPAPRMLSRATARTFGYGLFSARTGNIYTSSLLLQWTRWALEAATPPKLRWQQGAAVFDPFRPTIEPGGFASLKEMLRSRERAVRAFRECIVEADCFIFTLGLTESWSSAARGVEFPLCPGTAAGRFDPADHVFTDQGYPAVLANLRHALDLMRAANPRLRFVLTVSPVPLVATASGAHVLVATTAAKAVLRAVAGALAAEREDVDYFPSYELVAGAAARGAFFAANGRDVTPDGVAFVMDQFFAGVAAPGEGAAVEAAASSAPAAPRPPAAAPSVEDAICEEELLAAFGPVEAGR